MKHLGEGKNIENKNTTEINDIRNEINFLKMDVEIMGNGGWNTGIGKEGFGFNKGFEIENENPYMTRKYIIIDGKEYTENLLLDKSTGPCYYRSYVTKSQVGYLYVGGLKKNRFDGEGMMFFKNGNKYRGNWKNNKPTEGKVKFNGKEYDVAYEEGKGLKIVSEGEYKGKHIKLGIGEFAD